VMGMLGALIPQLLPLPVPFPAFYPSWPQPASS
jgi:hypothetical protein